MSVIGWSVRVIFPHLSSFTSIIINYQQLNERSQIIAPSMHHYILYVKCDMKDKHMVNYLFNV